MHDIKAFLRPTTHVGVGSRSCSFFYTRRCRGGVCDRFGWRLSGVGGCKETVWGTTAGAVRRCDECGVMGVSVCKREARMGTRRKGKSEKEKASEGNGERRRLPLSAGTFGDYSIKSSFPFPKPLAYLFLSLTHSLSLLSLSLSHFISLSLPLAPHPLSLLILAAIMRR